MAAAAPIPTPKQQQIQNGRRAKKIDITQQAMTTPTIIPIRFLMALTRAVTIIISREDH